MAKDSLIQFKGTSLKIIQTQLRTTDPVTLHSALAELTGNSPDFFEDELAVLDFSNAEDLPEFVDWTQLRELLRGSGLSAVATRGLPPALASAAAAAGLPQVGADALSRAPRVQVAKPPVAPVTDAAPPPPAEPQPAPRTVILDKPLRSGQRFYARGSDLIVTAMISAGAEVIADGNIHVYGPLRGRAIAGARGNTEARIFSTCMEPQLVSIAGIYRTTEQPLAANVLGQIAQVRLDGEKILVEPLAA